MMSTKAGLHSSTADALCLHVVVQPATSTSTLACYIHLLGCTTACDVSVSHHQLVQHNTLENCKNAHNSMRMHDCFMAAARPITDWLCGLEVPRTHNEMPGATRP
jgi:hypothetical protein